MGPAQKKKKNPRHLDTERTGEKSRLGTQKGNWRVKKTRVPLTTS